MGKYVHREVVKGRLTVTEIKRTKEDGQHVLVLVYEGREEKGEPVSEWVLPMEVIYDYSIAAKLAEAQTPDKEIFSTPARP